MGVTVMKANTMSSEVGLKMIVYGAPGVGKTTFASTAKDVVFIIPDSCGVLALKDKNVDVIPISEFKQMAEAFEVVRTGQWKTVVLDHLTEIQKMSMDSILQKEGQFKPRQNDWGENLRQMLEMCRKYRNLPMNVIFLAHEANDKDEETGVRYTQLSVNGVKLPQDLAGLVSAVGYMAASSKIDPTTKKEVISRGIRFGTSKNIMCKDNSGRLDIWEEPDFEAIYKKIFGNTEVGATADNEKPKESPEKPTKKTRISKEEEEAKAKTEDNDTVAESKTEATKGTPIDVVATRNEVIELLKKKYSNDVRQIKKHLADLGYKSTMDIPEDKLLEMLLTLRTEVNSEII